AREASEHRAMLMKLRAQDRPAIAVFITVCGETIDVIRDTIADALTAALEYGGRVIVYVLDDSQPDCDGLPLPVELLCRDFRTRGYPLHYENRKRYTDRDHAGYKGGNLQN